MSLDQFPQRLSLPAVFAVPSVHTLRYFFWAVQDRADGLDSLT